MVMVSGGMNHYTTIQRQLYMDHPVIIYGEQTSNQSMVSVITYYVTCMDYT